jgi:hypothetical protein
MHLSLCASLARCRQLPVTLTLAANAIQWTSAWHSRTHNTSQVIALTHALGVMHCHVVDGASVQVASVHTPIAAGTMESKHPPVGCSRPCRVIVLTTISSSQRKTLSHATRERANKGRRLTQVEIVWCFTKNQLHSDHDVLMQQCPCAPLSRFQQLPVTLTLAANALTYAQHKQFVALLHSHDHNSADVLVKQRSPPESTATRTEHDLGWSRYL